MIERKLQIYSMRVNQYLAKNIILLKSKSQSSTKIILKADNERLDYAFMEHNQKEDTLRKALMKGLFKEVAWK